MKKLERVLSMLMALVLMIGMTIPTVSAVGAEVGKETIKYVSLGDSMTNGYGLTGYNGNTGVLDYGEESYTNLFADWLSNTTGSEVEHAQLAMSAMRVEDLHWLLEVDYTDQAVLKLIGDMETYHNGPHDSEETWEAYRENWYELFTTGDYWTWDELVNHYRFRVAANYINYYSDSANTNTDIDLQKDWGDYNASMSDVDALKIVAKYYQDAVAEADVLTLAVGNGNFGVFAFGRIQEAIGFGGYPDETMIYDIEDAIRECDPAVQKYLLDLIDELKVVLKENGIEVDDGDPNNTSTMEAMANTVLYCAVSYVLNYAGTLEAILEVNPDAEIVILGLMNTFQDSGDVEGISLYDLLEALLTPMNVYMAALPTVMQAAGNTTYNGAKLYYAEAEYIESIAHVYDETIGDEDSVVRERFIESIVGNSGEGLPWQLLNSLGLVTIGLSDIKAYESNNIQTILTNSSKTTSIVVYKGLEDAILASKDAPISVESVLTLTNLNFDSVLAAYEANVTAAVAAIDDSKMNEIFAAVAGASNGYLSADQVKQMYNSNNDTHNVVTTVTGICTALVTPDALSAALTADETISGLLNLYATCIIGNGVGGHPSESGHETLFEAVKNAYANKYTVKDETINNAIEALQIVVGLITEYYDEAYAYGYQYAVDNGYIDKAVAGIDEAIAAVKGIDISNVEMTEAFRAQLNAELDAVVKTLEKAKAAVRSASTLDALKLAAQEMCDELNQHLLTVRALGEQAGTDVIELIVIPALEKAVEIVDTQLIPAVQEAIKQANAYLSAMLGQIYDEVVAKVTAIVGKYVPEAEAWINKWLNAGADMKAQLEELKAQLDSLRADLEKAIEEGKQELFDEIQKQIDQVVTEMESLIGKFVNSIFSANYVRKENSSYAAIVGNTDSYVAAVAELLGLDVKSMNWGALNLSTLATSDLITIGFDEAELYSFAVDQMLAYVAEYADEELRATLEAYMKNVLTKGTGNLLTDKQVKDSIAAVGTYLDQILADDLFADKTVQTLDWSAFLGKYTSYVDAARAKLYEALNENDIPTTYTLKINLIDYLEQMDVAEINWDTVRANLGDEAFCTVELPMADFADVFAESLLYGMISFNVQYAQTVQTITAVNPDAKILLLNHYNPISGLTLTVEDVTIELGEIYDVVANVASIHPLIYAVINDNVVYVDVQDTQTVFGQLVDFGVVDNTLENLVMTVVEYGNVLTASANGNAYIAQQIINALNITCGHWDNDNNHKCDNCGEVISECADTDNDHKCDVCGKVLSECVDSDGDYKCDICGKSVGTPETKPAETETTEPGTTKPTEPDTTKPTEPDTTEPTEPGTTEPTEPGTTEPTEPGTTEPTEPGTTEPTEPGTTEPTEPGTTEPTEPGTTEPTEPDTTPTEPVDPDDGLPTIAVIGIVAGSVVALGGIGYLLFFLFKKKII